MQYEYDYEDIDMKIDYRKLSLLMVVAVLMLILIWKTYHQENTKVLAEVHEAILDEYGDFYIPSKRIDSDQMASVFGVTMAYVEEYIGECAMMSTHVDVFIGIKASRGHSDEIRQQLLVYRDKMIQLYQNDPAKLAKITASDVYDFDEYVFYMVLGQNSDTVSNDKGDYLTQAARDNQRGEAILVKVFK